MEPVAAATSVKVGAERPVTATDLGVAAANNSPALAVDPTDSRFVVDAHRIDSPPYGCGLAISGDGGRGWISAEPVNKLPEGEEHCYAPEVMFGRDGTLYYLFVGLQGPGYEPGGAYLTTSRNRARTFTDPWRVLGPENFQVRLAIDPSIGPKGRLYLVWLHASVAPPIGGLANAANPILSAYSDDGGHTFTDPIPVSDAARRLAVAPAIAVGQDHRVHVSYYDLQNDFRDYQGLDGPAWDGTWSLITTSADRNLHFEPGIVVDDRISPPGRVMLIYTMPPPALALDRTGRRIYVAWTDARFGDPDILTARSLDGGRTWRPPARINDDPRDRPATQELPRLSVAPNGRLDAIFFDRRNDAENLKADVYFATSSDDGATFAPNVRLTRESSDMRIGQEYQIPSAVGLVEFGSRLALLSRATSALASWPDTRNASIGTNEQDLFLVDVQLGAHGSKTSAWIIRASLGAALLLIIAGVVVVRRRRPATSTESG